MHKAYLIIILFIGAGEYVFSQDTLELHPAVGKLIDRATKKDYLLFPEIKDSLLQYCFIKMTGEKFYLVSHFINDSVSTKEIELSALQQYHKNINKLLEYYSIKAKNDSIEKAGGTFPEQNSQYKEEKMNKELAAPQMNQQMKDEVRRDARLKSDAIRMKDYQQGTGSMPVNIELFNTEKKKK